MLVPKFPVYSRLRQWGSMWVISPANLASPQTRKHNHKKETTLLKRKRPSRRPKTRAHLRGRGRRVRSSCPPLSPGRSCRTAQAADNQAFPQKMQGGCFHPARQGASARRRRAAAAARRVRMTAMLALRHVTGRNVLL